ncbi:porin family protein [uncultured Mucilaginibacter sp.]|uniref:porin family protein n=1 Tax=uncultured Mucilaginibacter sp. TaxID=797541 RepID=UPI002600FFA5|nr:porin family protein [uncultured Mucilaginibacter sp.]
MKKALLILLVLLASKTFSQTVSYGLSAGINYSNLSGNGNPITSSYLIGIRAGGLVDIGFKNFSIQPGLLFTKMGGQNTTKTEQLILNYLEIPVNFLYHEKERAGNFFIGGGPYISFGTLATNIYTGLRNNFFFGNNEGLHRADVGLSALTGYQFTSGFAISGGYSMGITDVYSGGANNKNSAFNISVEYFFKL